MKFEGKKKTPLLLESGDIFSRRGGVYMVAVDNRLSGTQYRIVCLEGAYVSMDTPKYTVEETYEKYFGVSPEGDNNLNVDNIIKRDEVFITYKKEA